MRFLPGAPLLVATVLLAAAPALARQKKPRVTFEDTRRSRPSVEYASMGKAACLKALAARKIGFTSVDKARGVLAPVRLTGDVSGVVFRTDGPAVERGASPAEVFDCRLVLALSDLSRELVVRGIDEVRIASAWRPAKTKSASSAPARRHAGGLAVDVKRFGKKLAPGEKVKRWLSVSSDFRGALGAPLCRDRPRSQSLPAPAKELRAIVCAAHDRRLFTSILTPNYDRAHRDHLHFELRPAVDWSLLL